MYQQDSPVVDVNDDAEGQLVTEEGIEENELRPQAIHDTLPEQSVNTITPSLAQERPVEDVEASTILKQELHPSIRSHQEEMSMTETSQSVDEAARISNMVDGNKPDSAAQNVVESKEETASQLSDLEMIRVEVLGTDKGPTASADAQSSSPHTPNQPSMDASDDLKRLRDLVMATRGTKAQLPPGWDDTEVETAPTEETCAPNTGSTTHLMQVSEPTAQALLDSAIAKVGKEVPDSESEDSSSPESSSSSAEDSSDSGSDLDDDIKKALRPKKDITQYDSDDDEDDGEGGSGTKARGPVTKNEVVDPTIDPPPYSIVPDDREVRPMGKIHSIVDNVVVVAQDTGMAPGAEQSIRVRAATGSSHLLPPPPVDRQGRVGEQEGEYSVLDTGSLLAFDDRTVLGVVYETFGSVQGPLYALRYPSSTSINREVISVGRSVGYVPADSTYVLTRALRALGKGSDASNLYDEEVGEDEREFSDDEAEARSKAARKSAKRTSDSVADGSGTTLAGNSKGRKRATHDQGRAVGGNTTSVVRHGLPPRPMGAAAMAVHRDTDQTSSTTRALPLPYDDVEGQGGDSAIDAVISQQHYSATPPSALHPTTTHPAFQHIRPRGQSSNPMRGRGRGRGAPSSGGHSNMSTNGAYNHAFAPSSLAAGWPSADTSNTAQTYQPIQHFYPHQYSSAYGQVSGHTWPAAYNSNSLINHAYQQQQQQQQQSPAPYAAYPYHSMSSAQGSLLERGQATSSDSSSSYDPAQPQMSFTQPTHDGAWQPTSQPPSWPQ